MKERRVDKRQRETHRLRNKHMQTGRQADRQNGAVFYISERPK